MLNFHQLRAFYYVAENLHLSKAAEKLYITQPAVTMQIKLFEEFCKLKLFKRSKQKVFLTNEGKTLYEYARRIFEYEKEIENAVEDLRELKRGCLHLGTTKTYARYLMSSLMTRFHDAYPQIKINLNEGSSMDMMHSLLDFINEVVIISKVEDNPNVHFIPFVREDLVLILSSGHPLTRKKSISLKELAEHPIIMKETGSGTRKLVNELFARNNFVPNILMETSNTELIKQLVQRGEGISFLTRMSVVQELQEKKLAAISLQSQPIFLESYIAYLKNQPLSPSAQAFLEVLGNLAPKDKSFYGIEAFNAQQ